MTQTLVQDAGIGASRAIGLQSALLRSPEFDLTLVGVTCLWALMAGSAIVGNPALLLPILTLDVWLLGYQHVVATYTRLAFDSESFACHRALVVVLPVVVAATTLGAVWSVGPWIVSTTYLYWQWFHYTRQSYGISRMYLRKADALPPQHDPIAFGVTYLLPLWGILRRSAQHPATFLSLSLWTVPVPQPLLVLVAGAALGCLAIWVPREVMAVRRDPRRIFYAGYMVTHIAIFTTGYLLIDDINVGWLVLNIWHNLQYLLIVWMYNANRFKRGADPQCWLLSTMSQPKNILLYIAVSVGLATLLFVNIQRGLEFLSPHVLPMSFAVYMVINFHHYVVDAIIWRRPRPAAGAPLPV